MQREIMSVRGFNRIFEGELVPQFNKSGEVHHWRVKGFRHEDATGGAVIEGTRGCPDARGVYNARVRLAGGREGKQSSFFPSHWTREQVLQAIAEAYETREPRVWQEAGNFFEGRTSAGLRIVLELDEENKVLDAIPLKSHISHQRLTLWRLERGEVKASRYICATCGAVKVRCLVCPKWHDAPTRRTVLRRILRRLKAMCSL